MYKFLYTERRGDGIIPKVYEVFVVAIKELCSNSSNRKNVAEKRHAKGVDRMSFFVNPTL